MTETLYSYLTGGLLVATIAVAIPTLFAIGIASLIVGLAFLRVSLNYLILLLQCIDVAIFIATKTAAQVVTKWVNYELGLIIHNSAVLIKPHFDWYARKGSIHSYDEYDDNPEQLTDEYIAAALSSNPLNLFLSRLK